MGKFKKTDRLGCSESERRDFLRLMVMTGSVMGVRPWRVFEVLEDTAGTAVAQQAAGSTINKSIHINAGTGALSRFYLFWPHVEVAKELDRMRNAGVAPLATSIAVARDRATLKEGTDKPLYLIEDSPFKDLPGRRQVSLLMGGENQVHSETWTSNCYMPTGAAGTTRTESSVFAAAAVLQQRESSAAIPVMSVDTIRAGQMQPFGSAPGSSNIPVARARTFQGLVDMVASEAAKAGNVLALADNAQLYSRYYDAIKRLSRASSNYSYQQAYKNSDQAVGVMLQQLASQLTPTDDDVDRYLGLNSDLIRNLLPSASRDTAAARVAAVDTATANGVTSRIGGLQNSNFARTLILASRAFKLGVTNMVMLPSFNDDPHGFLVDAVAFQAQTFMTGTTLDQFLADCTAAPDPTAGNGSTVAQNLVMHIYGDCTKNALDKAGWPDNPQRDSNFAIVHGAGWLKTGWYGGISPPANPATGLALGSVAVNNLDIYDPTHPDAPLTTLTNANDVGSLRCKQLGPHVAGAVLYAICNGQIDKWREFYSGDALPGIINIDRAT
jgi:hypothetical protein